MGRTVLLDKMKKIDSIFLLCWALLFACFVAIYILGKVVLPAYFFALFLGLNIVLLLYIIMNKKQKNALGVALKGAYDSVYTGDYTLIKNNSDNEIFILLDMLVTDVERNRDDLKNVIKLVSAIEKEEINSFSESSANKNVNNALKVI